MKKFTLIFLLSLTCSILLITCRQNKNVSDEEYLAFIDNVFKEIYDGRTALLNASVDYEEFAKRILAEGNDFDKKKLIEFLQTYFKLGSMMADQIMDGADIRMIKFYRQDNVAHAIIRTYYNGGISVEDWELEKKDDIIMINDAFAIVSGIYWSDDWRTKAANQFSVVDDDVLLNYKLIEINELISVGAYEEADSSFFWVEQAIKNNLYGRTMKLNLASLSKSYEEVVAMSNAFLKSFPEQKNIAEFYQMQSAIQLGLTDKLSQHIDNLTNTLGNDPIYFVYQSWTYQRAGQLEMALQTLDSAIAYMPQVYDLYHNQLDIYYETARYDDFVKLLYRIDTFFAPTGEDVPFFEKTYPKLLKNKDFNTWKENRPIPQDMY
ncbi:MAG TPA: hypothetical protein PLF32_08075 [Bacteroidales bacterium]|nr:hypothetical protein [Bacteroidales bacterium]HPJ91999.1 hypothetical protein [Bacteroidales bacterium]